MTPQQQEGMTRGAAGLAGVSSKPATPSISQLTTIPPDELYPVKSPWLTHHESRLLNYLLTNYNNKVRPILDHNSNITVHVGITLTQIFDMVRLFGLRDDRKFQ